MLLLMLLPKNYNIQLEGMTAHQLLCPLPWERRLSTKLQNLRGDLSQLEELKAGQLASKSTKMLLLSSYSVSSTTLPTTIKNLRQEVIAIVSRLSRYRKQTTRRKQNELFSTNHPASICFCEWAPRMDDYRKNSFVVKDKPKETIHQTLDQSHFYQQCGNYYPVF